MQILSRKAILNRDELSRMFCTGTGVELGPGSIPTAVADDVNIYYVDKRKSEELKAYFGRDDVVVGGALSDFEKGSFNFLMAHHVLEHCSNVVDTLLDWISYLKDGGTLFLTVPNASLTPDAGRLVTPPTHFVRDYILSTNDSSYESREHISSFLWGWCEDGGLAGKSKQESKLLVSQALHAQENDLHWHVFTVTTLRFVVELVAALLDKRVEFHYCQSGDGQSIEHTVVASLHDLGTLAPKVDVSYIKKLKVELGSKVMDTTLRFLEGRLIHDLSQSDSGKLFLANNGQARWIVDGKALEELTLVNSESTYVDFESVAQDISGERIASTEYLVAYDRGKAIKDRLPLNTGKGLELSPGARPIVSKDEANVKYADKADYEQFKQIYKEDTSIKLDTVLGESLIDDAFSENEFDYIVSSHVIEHIPDFIQFFISASKVLKTGGKLVKLVPDRRYTFDALRDDSTIEQIELAYQNAYRNPSRDMIYDFYSKIDTNVVASKIWDGSYMPKPMYSEEEVKQFCKKSELEGADVHCWVFTPTSMRLLLEHVRDKYIPSLRIVEISETPEGCNEFLMHVEI